MRLFLTRPQNPLLGLRRGVAVSVPAGHQPQGVKGSNLSLEEGFS